ncbi:MAG: AAA family ATPase [Magnetovibrio sp.]|nr:AAA family ATPase [Magnetovibrio sp.]
MTIITIGGEKGGVGKSTVATNVSVVLAQAGKDVLLINTDAQDTIGSWAAIRAEDHANKHVVHTASLHGKTVSKEILDFSERYDVVVVDAAGNDSVEQRQAMAVSDALIIPIRPTAFDTWTLDTVEDLVGQPRA